MTQESPLFGSSNTTLNMPDLRTVSTKDPPRFFEVSAKGDTWVEVPHAPARVSVPSISTQRADMDLDANSGSVVVIPTEAPFLYAFTEEQMKTCLLRFFKSHMTVDEYVSELSNVYRYFAESDEEDEEGEDDEEEYPESD